jgi:hypothetical protein
MIYDPLAIEYNRGYNAAMETQLHRIDREERRFTAAVAAMQGLMANPNCTVSADEAIKYGGCEAAVASAVVKQADALLEELAK